MALTATSSRGTEELVAGNQISVGSGGRIDIASGGALSIAATAITSTAAELNILDGVTSTAAEINLLDASATLPADGPLAAVSRWAKATWDFSVDGGTGAIGLGVTIPDDAVIINGFVDVITTCTTAGADAGSGAISVEGANDIVTAVTVVAAADWDAGVKDIIPDGTGSAAVKTTSAQEITFTIAIQDFTAGKFDVYLEYLVSEVVV